MTASSLNKPSSQEGLKNCPFCGSEAMYDDGEHAVVCTNRIRCSIVGPTRFERSYAINQWNTRHPSFNDAIEATYATCRMFVEEECYLDQTPYGTSRRAIHAVGLAIRDRINCVIRSLKLPDYRGGDSEKTAESGHSPTSITSC